MTSPLVPLSDKAGDFLEAVRRDSTADIRSDAVSRILYSTDASIYQVAPLGVILPRTREDVAVVTGLAGRFRMPLLPRGSGTSLAGQAVNEAFILDFTRHLDRIVEINAEARYARVEPGVILDDLNALLRPQGVQFGPDPASSDRASLGGIVGSNSTGAHSLLYGMTVEHLREVEAVLSDGSVARFGAMEAEPSEVAPGMPLAARVTAGLRRLTRERADVIRAATPRHWRRCGGYSVDQFVDGVSSRLPRDPRFNPAKIFCGAEGTLGALTEITVGLVDRKPFRSLAAISFPSLRAALDRVPAILETDPSTVELIDHTSLTLCRQSAEYSRLLNGLVPGEPFCLLAVEYEGVEAGEPGAGLDRLAARLRGPNAPQIERLIEPERQARLWAIRKAGLGLIMSTRSRRKPLAFLEDAAVPVEHLATYVDRVESFCREMGVNITYYAHASTGCLHIRPALDLHDPADQARIPEIQRHAAQWVREFGGSVSSEHGDGRSRSWLNEILFGPEMVAVFRDVKQLFDPQNLFNPGNIADPPRSDQNLRMSGARAPSEPVSLLDFSDEGGFVAAVEQCNGAASCRKRATGVMCPSFMATREEEHSTRGRANVLRAVIEGRLPAQDWAHPDVARVMDLCLECKACKAECPSAVDMARIKIEWLARVQKIQGTTLRSRLFADAWKAAKLAAGPLAPMANAVLRARPVRLLLEKTVGISARRPLPPFARHPFAAWFKTHRPRSPETAPGAEADVAIFDDEFNAGYDPDVLAAAVAVLEASGCTVRVCGIRSSGRAALSRGMLKQARAEASDTLDRLMPFAEKGIPVIGLEPSAILSLRDEYRALLPGDPRVERCAALCRTFEEFIADRWKKTSPPPFRPGPKRILLHGHCHQKAISGIAPVQFALGVLPGAKVETLDTTCCGMAGSFGFEAEHYDLSLAIGELKLFPAIRAAGPEAEIAASGISCRQQILHGTGRRAKHPAQLLRDALTSTIQRNDTP